MTGVLEGLREGDPIVVSDSQNCIGHVTVAKVGRVWLFDSRGWKYRIDTGEAEERLQFGHGTQAMTVATWQAREEERLLREALRRWGFFPLATLPQHELTREQLRLVAALLEHFEGGDYRDLLGRVDDTGHEVADGAHQFAADLRGARRRLIVESCTP